jgi:hypothetical protein
MVLIGYCNVVVLVNVDREETVSRIELDANVFVYKSLSVRNMFGIYSAIIITKLMNWANSLS